MTVGRLGPNTLVSEDEQPTQNQLAIDGDLLNSLTMCYIPDVGSSQLIYHDLHSHLLRLQNYVEKTKNRSKTLILTYVSEWHFQVERLSEGRRH